MNCTKSRRFTPKSFSNSTWETTTWHPRTETRRFRCWRWLIRWGSYRRGCMSLRVTCMSSRASSRQYIILSARSPSRSSKPTRSTTLWSRKPRKSKSLSIGFEPRLKPVSLSSTTWKRRWKCWRKSGAIWKKGERKIRSISLNSSSWEIFVRLRCTRLRRESSVWRSRGNRCLRIRCCLRI